jgi:hypothetical protein
MMYHSLASVKPSHSLTLAAEQLWEAASAMALSPKICLKFHRAERNFRQDPVLRQR